MDDHITPDIFKESFVEKTEEFADSAKTYIKESTKRGLKMNNADKVWLAAIACGGIFLRDRQMKRRIKELKKLSHILNRENELLHTFVTGRV